MKKAAIDIGTNSIRLLISKTGELADRENIFFLESTRLGEGAELNGTPPGSLDLVDATWYALITDKCLIGGIEQDQALILQCPVDPPCKLLPGHHRTSGVVGVTEIDNIYSLLR